MMSTDSSTTRETGPRYQTDHPGEIYEQSSHERNPFTDHSLFESLDPPPPPPPSEESKRVSKGILPSSTNQGSAVTLGKTTTANAGGSSNRGNFMDSMTVSEPSSSQVESKVTSDTSITPPISSANATSTVTTTAVTIATPTTDSALLSKATNSTTTTTTFPQGRSPLSSFPRSQPLRPKMGLYQPTIGVNGHALPQGAGESRDAPRNPSALPLGASDSAVRHRERLIGPVTACVAPPPLRIADAQRERDRLTSVSQRLMSRPVKRKLWEVDHDKLGPEIEAEYKQMIEDDEKRFKERWVELGPDDSPGAPSFYRSEITPPSKRRTTASSSSEAEASTSRPPVEEPVNTKIDKNSQQVSGALKSKPIGKDINAEAEKTLPPALKIDCKESIDCPKDGSKPPKVPPGVSSKKLVERQVSVKETLSRGDSPLAVSSSSSTPGVSSLETTPVKKTTNSTKDMPSEERTLRTRSMTSAQEKNTHPRSPVTRSSRRTPLKPYPQKHLRM